MSEVYIQEVNTSTAKRLLNCERKMAKVALAGCGGRGKQQFPDRNLSVCTTPKQNITVGMKATLVGLSPRGSPFVIGCHREVHLFNVSTSPPSPGHVTCRREQSLFLHLPLLPTSTGRRPGLHVCEGLCTRSHPSAVPPLDPFRRTRLAQPKT